MIVCGGDYTIIKNHKNEIYTCGANIYGQLGTGDNHNRNVFKKINMNFDASVKKIACGNCHTIILNDKNEIWINGSNNFGQLGCGNNYNHNRNTEIKIDKNIGTIKNISCGDCYSVIQNNKNEVYVCGWNTFGQLGINSYENINRFRKIEYDFGNIKNILCGDSHTMIYNEKDEIYVCGWNAYGQLGIDNYKSTSYFEKIERDFGNIKNISCGSNHVMVCNEKNEIFACGQNIEGQLGLGDNRNRKNFEKIEYDFGIIQNISCGAYHTVIQNDKNEIFVTGNNNYGQLGLGNNKDKNKFEKINFKFGIIHNISCGNNHTVVQNCENEIYVCGYNAYGQLGLGDNEDKYEFERINTDDIFDRIYNFHLDLQSDKILL